MSHISSWWFLGWIIDLENTTSMVLKLSLSHCWCLHSKDPHPLRKKREQMRVQEHMESEQNSSPATPLYQQGVEVSALSSAGSWKP